MPGLGAGPVLKVVQVATAQVATLQAVERVRANLPLALYPPTRQSVVDQARRSLTRSFARPI